MPALKNPRQVALACARLAVERKAENVVVLDVHKLLYLTEFFVIATGQSDRHLRALADEMTDELKESGVERFGLEGVEDARWVLADFGGVIVHLFNDKARGFYDLEGMWADAKKVKTAGGEADADEPADEAPPAKRKAAKAAAKEKTPADLRKQAKHKAKKARNKAAKKAAKVKS